MTFMVMKSPSGDFIVVDCDRIVEGPMTPGSTIRASGYEGDHRLMAICTKRSEAESTKKAYEDGSAEGPIGLPPRMIGVQPIRRRSARSATPSLPLTPSSNLPSSSHAPTKATKNLFAQFAGFGAGKTASSITSATASTTAASSSASAAPGSTSTPMPASQFDLLFGIVQDMQREMRDNFAKITAQLTDLRTAQDVTDETALAASEAVMNGAQKVVTLVETTKATAESTVKMKEDITEIMKRMPTRPELHYTFLTQSDTEACVKSKYQLTATALHAKLFSDKEAMQEWDLLPRDKASWLVQACLHYHPNVFGSWDEMKSEVARRINSYASNYRLGRLKLPSVKKAEAEAKAALREKAVEKALKKAQKREEERKEREAELDESDDDLEESGGEQEESEDGSGGGETASDKKKMKRIRQLFNKKQEKTTEEAAEEYGSDDSFVRGRRAAKQKKKKAEPKASRKRRVLDESGSEDEEQIGKKKEKKRVKRELRSSSDSEEEAQICKKTEKKRVKREMRSPSSHSLRSLHMEEDVE